MKTRNILIVLTIALSLIHCTTETGKNDACIYENWPGKNGEVKTEVEIPAHFFSSNDMFLRESSTEKFVRFKVIFYENDSIKEGYLHTQIFPTIEDAQFALKEYLETITNPEGLSCLTNEDFKAGDVSFGKKYDMYLRMCFTRNNVLSIIYASTEQVLNISEGIDVAIQNAPHWQTGMPEPLFILPD